LNKSKVLDKDLPDSRRSRSDYQNDDNDTSGVHGKSRKSSDI